MEPARIRYNRPAQSSAPPAPVPPQPQPKRRRKLKLTKKHWVAAAIVLLIVAIGALAYGYMQTRKQLTEQSQGKGGGAQTEIQRIVGQVEDTIELPADETPTLATVDNVDKLKEQNPEFFKNAQTGDKLLIYKSASRALLYRPSTEKIIEYLPVSLAEE